MCNNWWLQEEVIKPPPSFCMKRRRRRWNTTSQASIHWPLLSSLCPSRSPWASCGKPCARGSQKSKASFPSQKLINLRHLNGALEMDGFSLRTKQAAPDHEYIIFSSLHRTSSWTIEPWKIIRAAVISIMLLQRGSTIDFDTLVLTECKPEILRGHSLTNYAGNWIKLV